MPKLWVALGTAGGVGAAFAGGLDLTRTVSAGSIIVAAMVVILGGVFTFRTNMKSFWKGLAEERGAEIEALKTELLKKDREHVDFAEAQREIRHDLKADLAAANAALEAEKTKTDLTSVIETMNAQHQEVVEYLRDAQTTGVQTVTDMLSAMTAKIEEMSERIAENLSNAHAGQGELGTLLEQIRDELKTLNNGNLVK